MNIQDLAKQLIDALIPAAKDSHLSYVELIVQEGDAPVSAGSRLLYDDFSAVEFMDIDVDSLAPAIGSQEVIESSLTVKGKPSIPCIIRPLAGEKGKGGFALFEFKKTPDDALKSLCCLFANTAGVLFMLARSSPGADTTDEKYKSELIKMRTVQAELFPKFEEIESMDISAVYLPADLMTGTFIDAFFVDDHIYQIVASDIQGSDPSSTIAGASVRALVRSLSTKQVIPSSLIDRLTGRINKVLPYIHSMLQMTVFKVNIRTGAVVISSYGEIHTLFYSIARKGVVDLGQTSIGKDLAKKIIIKDLNLRLEKGDALFYFTKSASAVMNEKRTDSFGDARIKKTFLDNSDGTSRDIVHELTNSIYEYSNYSPLENDIILLCIKMK